MGVRQMRKINFFALPLPKYNIFSGGGEIEIVGIGRQTDLVHLERHLT